MKVSVDPDRCLGAGQCVLAAREVFDQREDDGIVVLLTETPDPGQYENVREAARLCPALVIELAEDGAA
jgi:ferredoxin